MLDLRKNVMNLTSYHAKYYAYDILSKTRNDIAAIIFNAKVEFNPHQIMAAQFAIKSPVNKGVILADEVGLGKTIEAGLILAQMWAERKRKIIIVCPAVLRKQWSEELRNKFALDSIILDNKFINDKNNLKTELINEKDPKILICSYNLLNRDYAKDKLKTINFDLAVFDEAHKLRNQKAITYTSCDELFKYTKKILLTATPLQNSLKELYGLVNIIDDKLFSSDRVLSGKLADVEIARLKERLKPIIMRTLRKDVASFIKYTKRNSETFNYQSSSFELQVFKSIEQFINNQLQIFYDPRVIHLIRVALLKIKSSSSIAIYETLLKVKYRIEHTVTTNNIIQDVNDIDEEVIQDILEDSEDEDENLEVKVSGKVLDKEQLSAEELKIRQQEALAELNGIMQNLKILIENNKDSKLPNLDKAVKFGMLRMKDIGAAEKCVIFTESLITQKFLYQYLEERGYKDKIVLFNSSNNDDKSKEIYNQWKANKSNRNRISGVKAADMKLAIIDYFEHHAKIMIATDSASEGVNLQFCSLLMNFDLPWNPQRIEQRIGRIHRYGQKHDVVIINFLDTMNLIDERIFNILDKKIGLFNGMFGASNEILGRITNLNNGFEKQIYNIYMNCRTETEIIEEFDLLGEQFKDERSKRFEAAKEVLHTDFDEDVHQLLKNLEQENKQRLDSISLKFWNLTKYQLPQFANDVKFNEDEKSFELQEPVQNNIPGIYYLIKKDNFEGQKDYTNNQLYRANHPLGKLIIDAAKNEDTPSVLVEFNLSKYDKKVAALEPYKNKFGTLALEHLIIDTNGSQEDFLIFSGKLENGETLNQKECERLFNLDAVVKTSVANFQDLKELQQNAKQDAIARYEQNKSKDYQDEYDKIEYYRADISNDFIEEINVIDKQIRDTHNLMSQAANLSDKWQYTSQIEKLRGNKRSLEQEKQNKEYELGNELSELMQNYETQLEPKINSSNLF
ncbi:MAG: hypothetical protein RL017_436, partial [Pseudomonadota bacterium]